MLRSLAYLRLVIRNRLVEAAHRHGLAHAAAYVMEFPKSGGTWLKRMTQALVDHDLAGRGVEQHEVVHDHWRHTHHLRPAVYVIRDGRDVVVSLYFHHVRDRLIGSPRAAHEDRYFRRVLGPGYDLDDVRVNLPPFIRSLHDHPFGGILRRSGNRRLLPWPAHIEEWLAHDDLCVVRYEDMLVDTPRQLRRVADHLALDVTVDVLADVAARHSFEAVTGRQPGQEDRSSFQRKGVAGDWRNHFTRAAGEAFLDFAGPTLVRLGYADDNRWVEALPVR